LAKKLKYKSDAFEAIHSADEGLYRAVAIDKATMRDFDESCLSVPPDIGLQQIKLIREKIMSASLFLLVI